MMNHVLTLLLLPLLLAGCSSITNLTPTKQARNANNLYSVEASWATRQHSLRGETIKPSVLIGLNSYPMEKVPAVKDRWEAVVPVAADQPFVYYRFRFDYEYNGLGEHKSDCKLSPEYKLVITEH